MFKILFYQEIANHTCQFPNFEIVMISTLCHRLIDPTDLQIVSIHMLYIFMHVFVLRFNWNYMNP